MKIIRNVFLFSIGFFLTFIALEVFISNTYIVNKSLNDVYADIGRGRRTNMFYVMFNEGFSMGRFNKFRYMGAEYPKEKDVNTLRIALIGDSFVEGFQVFDRDHFRRIIEVELSEKLNQNVEVLNFGRSGFDIGDMFAYNQTFVKEFNPDFSLFFLSNNDLIPRFSDPLRMKVRLKDDSLIVVKDYPSNYIQIFNRTKYLIQNSTIFTMLNSGHKLVKSDEFLHIIFDKFYPNKLESDNEYSNSFSEIPFALPELTLGIVDNLNSAKDIIVNKDIKSLNQEMVSEIRRHTINYIDLQDTLYYMKENQVDPYYWKATKKTGHWNHQAHKAVGEYLAKSLYQIIQQNSAYK